jgi:hypothetical protein
MVRRLAAAVALTIGASTAAVVSGGRPAAAD